MNFITSSEKIESFSDLSLPAHLMEALEAQHITSPTEIQKITLGPALAGQDLISIGKTGTGKTLIFALAILHRLESDPKARALVLTPSREVADQTFKVFEKIINQRPITSCLVVAGIPEKPQISSLKKIPRLIVATPGRMLDHLGNNKLLLQGLTILVIDELDRMLDAGFGPQIQKIKATLRGQRQTMMFGATLDYKAQKFSEEFFLSDCYLIKTDALAAPVDSLKQEVLFLDFGEKKEKLLKLVKGQKQKCIVFTNDQPNCEQLAEFLKENNVKADAIHGTLKIGHRDRVLRDFRENKVNVLITTDLLARGLDVPDIELVINFDLPHEPEDFLHRIGRTARAGKTGTAITFVSSAQEAQFKNFKAYITNAN